MPKSERELLRELAGTTCRCGATKRKGKTFCRRDYYNLPPSCARRLYSPFGAGYEDAYERACRMLDDLTAEEAEPESTL
jgi:hypothetical protein